MKHAALSCAVLLSIGCAPTPPDRPAVAATPSSRSRAPRAVTGVRWSEAANAFVRHGSDNAIGARLPLRATERVELQSGATTIAVTAEGLAPVVGVEEDGAVFYRDAAASTDVVFVDTFDGIEELRVLRDARAPLTYRWKISPPEGGRVRVRDGSIAVLDQGGVVRAATAPVVAVDEKGTSRALALSIEGDVVVASLDPAGLVYPITVDPSWGTTPTMRTVRSTPWAAKIAGGRVLVGGGQGPWVQLYDPATNDWTDVPDLPLTAWTDSKAVSLATGDVLVVAGGTSTGATRFRASTSTWQTAPAQAAACAGCALVLLNDGNVLKVPGTSGTVTPEIYNPTTNTWSSTTALTYSGQPSATLLADGRVFAFSAGGSGQSASIYNPTSKTWTTTPATDKHYGPQVARLSDDRVMVVGEIYGGSGFTPPARIWTPSTNSWAPTFPMVRARESATVIRLGAGRVLVVGGKVGDVYPNDAEIWDPLYGGWTLIDPFSVPGRVTAAATLLDDGSVLLVGGSGSSGPTNTAFRFVPIADGSSCTPPNYPAACKAAYCVDGVCCNEKSCPGGVCNAPAVPGRAAGMCAKNLGGTCTKAADCASGFCVDGVCCNSACTGQCESCSTAGAAGTCLPIKGAPVGGRPACDEGSSLCSARACNGTDGATCAGYAAGPDVSCARASCDGSNVVPESKCDGAGSCVAPMKSSCGKFACDPATAACRASCAAQSDCAAGFFCIAGTCAEGSRCSDDRTQSLSTTGGVTECSPYLCGTDGSGNCAKTCTSSRECAGGFICDPSGSCVAPAATEDSGGCSTSGAPARSGGLAAVFALVAWVALQRRRS